MNRILNIALCEGRHNIPQATDGAIFPQVVNPLDIEGMAAVVATKLQDVTDVNLYVTGLTVALVEVIKYCYFNDINLTLYHYDKNSNIYYPQLVNQLDYCPFCGNNFGTGRFCKNCGST